MPETPAEVEVSVSVGGELVFRLSSDDTVAVKNDSATLLEVRQALASATAFLEDFSSACTVATGSPEGQPRKGRREPRLRSLSLPRVVEDVPLDDDDSERDSLLLHYSSFENHTTSP